MNSICDIIREFNSVKITQRAHDGYLDATAMCKASNKQFKHYWENKSTAKFLEVLSLNVGIPTFKLVESKQGRYGGTWAHPKVAINLAQWCSPEFAVMVSDWVFELLTTGKVELQPEISQAKMLEYAQINKEFMTLFGIESNMQTLALNNAMQKQFGVNMLERWGINELKSETQEQTLTISDIANQLNIGKHKVNPILIEMGLQISARDHKNNIYYELTNAGKKYAIYVDTGKRHKTDGSPVRQIKWYSLVVDVLKAHLELRGTVV